MKKTLALIISLIIILQNIIIVSASEDYAYIEYSGVEPSLINISSYSNGRDYLLDAVERNGVPCVQMHTYDPEGKPVNYSYVTYDITKDFMFRLKDGTGVDVTVEYFDEGTGMFCITYDSRTEANKISEVVLLNNTMEWKTHTFHLYDAYFGNKLRSKDIAICLTDDGMSFSTSDLIFKSIKIEKSGKIFPLDISENVYKTGNIYVKGEKPVISLSVENILDKPVTASYSAVITNSAGEDVRTINDTVVFESGANLLEIETNITVYDVYNAEIFFTGSNNLYGKFKTNFSVSVVSQINERYGQNAHFGLTSRDPVVSMPLLKQLGASIIRSGVGWESYETEKGVYKIPEHWLNYAQAVKANGAVVIAGLGSGNHLYDDGLFPQSDEAVEAYGNYVYNVVSELKGIIDIFEFPNEIHHIAYNQGLTDLSTRKNPPLEVAEIFMKVQKVAYERAKEANPMCTFVGLGGLPGVWDNWVGKCLQAGAAEYMDVMSLHEYDEYGHPEKRMVTWLENVKNHMVEYGCEDMPIWITETGWSTSWDVSSTEKEKYSYGIRQYVMYQEFGIDKYMWYDFESDGVMVRDFQDNFGIVWANYDEFHVPYSARESYVAFSNMNDKLGNSHITAHDTLADGTEVYTFENSEGEETYILWNINEKTKTTVNIGTDKYDYMVYDVFGNGKRAVINANGDTEIKVSDVPVYIAPIDKPDFGVTEINYATGDVTVRVKGLSAEKYPSVMVLRPQKEVSDIYTQKLGALAYMAQPDSGKNVFEFTFTAEEEGTYNVYVNNGTEIIKIGAMYYKPLGVDVNILQSGSKIEEFTQLDTAKSFDVTADIVNIFGSASDYVMLCAKYSGGALVDIVREYGSISETEASKTASLTMEVTEDFDEIRIFMWNDETKIVPICDAVKIK